MRINREGKSRKNKAGLECLGSVLLQFGRAATTVATLPIPRVRFSIGVRHQFSIDDGSGPGVAEVGTLFKGTNHWMEGSHLMEEEGMEGENVSMKEGESSCAKERDSCMKEEDDAFEDTCNTTGSFSPSPAVSRRITMGVRGIRALEEWCRRAVQVRYNQKYQTEIDAFSQISDYYKIHQH